MNSAVDWIKDNYVTILLTVAVVAISIATMGVGGVVGGILIGAALGAGSSIIEQGIEKGFDNIDWLEVGISAAVGGAVGGLTNGAGGAIAGRIASTALGKSAGAALRSAGGAISKALAPAGRAIAKAGREIIAGAKSIMDDLLNAGTRTLSTDGAGMVKGAERVVERGARRVVGETVDDAMNAGRMHAARVGEEIGIFKAAPEKLPTARGGRAPNDMGRKGENYASKFLGLEKYHGNELGKYEPDFFNRFRGILGEPKNVRYLYLLPQMKRYLNISATERIPLILFICQNTRLSKPLSKALKDYGIIIEKFPW